MSRIETFSQEFIEQIQKKAKEKGFTVVILERERPTPNVIEFRVEISGNGKRSSR